MSVTVQSTIAYYCPPTDSSKPYINITLGEQNWTTEPHTVQIENISDTRDEYKLDEAGFQLYKRAAKHKAFVDDDKVKEEYYPESIELIKEATGATKVIIFDHTIRTNYKKKVQDIPGQRQPVLVAHVDQTTAAAEGHVRRRLSAEEAEERLKRRFQIINLWRPIEHAALDLPLAYCDYRSLDTENDLAPTTIIRAQPPNGETMGVKHNPNHRWKYVRGMTPDDFVLFKCFDNKLDGSRFTPHSAFVDPSTPPDAPMRKSIELRALVFYD